MVLLTCRWKKKPNFFVVFRMENILVFNQRLRGLGVFKIKVSPACYNFFSYVFVIFNIPSHQNFAIQLQVLFCLGFCNLEPGQAIFHVFIILCKYWENCFQCVQVIFWLCRVSFGLCLVCYIVGLLSHVSSTFGLTCIFYHVHALYFINMYISLLFFLLRHG